MLQNAWGAKEDLKNTHEEASRCLLIDTEHPINQYSCDIEVT
jgi:hypothetical protein